MDVQAELRSVQKPPAKPWRGGSSSAAPPPPPPKVYRVEPREFRDLVQRLTGAPPAAGVVRPQQHHQVAAVQPVPVRASREQQHQHQHHQQQQQQQQQQLYSSPWFSFPLGGVDGANGLM